MRFRRTERCAFGAAVWVGLMLQARVSARSRRRPPSGLMLCLEAGAKQELSMVGQLVTNFTWLAA